MKLLSEAVKTQITNDWMECFPDLGVYKPMWLLRRVGPLVTGICLDRDSGNDAYRPTFHVHSLAQRAPTVSLTLAEPLRTAKTGALETIRAAFHSDRFAEAAERFRNQTPFQLSGAIVLDDVLNAYRKYMAQPLGRYPLRLYEDIVALLLMCGQSGRAEESIREFVMQVASWPESINVLRNAGGVSLWREKCESWVRNTDKLRQTVSMQITELGLIDVPFSELEIR